MPSQLSKFKRSLVRSIGKKKSISKKTLQKLMKKVTPKKRKSSSRRRSPKRSCRMSKPKRSYRKRRLSPLQKTYFNFFKEKYALAPSYMTTAQKRAWVSEEWRKFLANAGIDMSQYRLGSGAAELVNPSYNHRLADKLVIPNYDHTAEYLKSLLPTTSSMQADNMSYLRSQAPIGTSAYSNIPNYPFADILGLGNQPSA